MAQEDKTTEQEIERIARVQLKERYKDIKVLWRLINEDFQDFELPSGEHVILAIGLRILDRLENIEKLLTRDEKYLILPVRQQTDDDKISILPLDCNIEHNKGE
jgi:hypothetical protein